MSAGDAPSALVDKEIWAIRERRGGPPGHGSLFWEPAPQPGKGPESTTTVLTAPRQCHLPRAPRMRKFESP